MARGAGLTSEETGISGVRRMHADELDIDAGLVQRLLEAQFPEWADLPIERVASAGTDNAIFRLGADRAVRLPRIHWAAAHPGKEFRWLPRVAPDLPLTVPVTMALGEPGEGYPWRWSVVPWLPGADANDSPPTDLNGLAADLAQFVTALHRVDWGGRTPADAPAASRGIPLAHRDEEVSAAIEQLHGVVDTDAAARAWQVARNVPGWDGPPVWIHGDLQPANLLMRGGRLTAIIDWGGLGIGDPAADLIPAWSIFSGDSREAFRAALAVDDDTWARGRGWALSVGLVALPYYADSNPVIADWARRQVDEVLADHSSARPGTGDRRGRV